MAFAKYEGNLFIIDGEIVKKHVILVDYFKFDGEYNQILSFRSCDCNCLTLLALTMH